MEDGNAVRGCKLAVKREKGEGRLVDVTCDSKFMQYAMKIVGKKIRETYHWVPVDWPIFLYLDNAGGHGTKEVVAEYVRELKEEHNVVCIHQRPRSPCTNILDLGVWMSFQSVVEKLHWQKRREKEALWGTVEKAWEQLEPIKLTNVYARWRLVLDLIIEDEGGNSLVESRRGKLFSVPSTELETPETLDPEEGEDEQLADIEADDFC